MSNKNSKKDANEIRGQNKIKKKKLNRRLNSEKLHLSLFIITAIYERRICGKQWSPRNYLIKHRKPSISKP
jgi:hypothetical protein